MQVKLKVLVGKSAGKEIAVPVSRFLIGRGKDCHMRPKSDAISRNHCAILVGEEKVVIRDLNSRNGTFVNDEAVEGDCKLKAGDRICVGKLEFEVVLKESKKSSKPKTKVKTKAKAKEAKAKKDKKDKKDKKVAQASDKGDSIEFDVSDWLEEADGLETARRQAEPDTRQFQLDETDRIQLEAAGQESTEGQDEGTQRAAAKPDKKKGPGKLPDRPAAAAASSRDAAADMLKKFFSNR